MEQVRQVLGAHQLTDPDPKDLEVHGLLDEVHHPHLDPGQGMLIAPVPGEDQHREIRIDLPDLGEGGNAVHPSHLQVQDHQIRSICREELQSVLSAPSLAHLETLSSQGLPGGVPELRLVVHQEDPDRFVTLRHDRFSSLRGRACPGNPGEASRRNSRT